MKNEFDIRKIFIDFYLKIKQGNVEVIKKCINDNIDVLKINHVKIISIASILGKTNNIQVLDAVFNSDLKNKYLKDVEPHDLLRFGLIPEFIGRLPVIATLEELDEAALMQILTEPRNALTKQYHKLFEMEGVDLEFSTESLTAIAKKAMERKTGARGLRSILEGVLLGTMYDLPSQEGVSRVVVDEKTITGDAEPLLIYENPEPASKAVPE